MFYVLSGSLINVRNGSRRVFVTCIYYVIVAGHALCPATSLHGFANTIVYIGSMNTIVYTGAMKTIIYTGAISTQ